MDFNNNNSFPEGYSYTPPVKVPGSGFANAAIMLGVITIVSAIMMTLYFPFIFGSLAIVFGILSKGSALKLSKQATGGIIFGSIGLTVNIGIIICSVLLIFSSPDSLRETAQTYDKMYEQIYGVPSEEILGDSMGNMIDKMIDNMGLTEK